MTPPTEDSFLLLKPDALERGLADHAVDAVRRASLTVTGRVPLRLTESQVAGIYPQVDPEQRPLTAGIIRRYLIGRPAEYVRVSGRDACARVVEVKTALRRELSDVLYGNLAHSPDTPDQAASQLLVLSGHGPRAVFTPGPRPWHGWSQERIEAALDVWAADAVEVGTRRPTRWSPLEATQGPVVRVAVPRRWVIAFDDIAAFLARLAGRDDPGFAVRATLAALYDRDGLPLEAPTAARADALVAQVTGFGLEATPAVGTDRSQRVARSGTR
ncbi:hypothetical protein AB0E10_09140 [Streptomyces sp. NPDC048045]|uniref:hypothetical protein n=1 Tax=Streptomyces sp. NPDC048045 TaxID=3154710 RepID=UPI003439B692